MAHVYILDLEVPNLKVLISLFHLKQQKGFTHLAERCLKTVEHTRLQTFENAEMEANLMLCLGKKNLFIPSKTDYFLRLLIYQYFEIWDF